LQLTNCNSNGKRKRKQIYWWQKVAMNQLHGKIKKEKSTIGKKVAID